MRGRQYIPSFRTVRQKCTLPPNSHYGMERTREEGASLSHIYHGLDSTDVSLPADDRNLVLFDFNHALHDQRLQKGRVLATLGHPGDL